MIGELEMAAWEVHLGHVTTHASLLPDRTDLGRNRGFCGVAIAAFRVIVSGVCLFWDMRIMACYTTDAIVAH